MKRDFSLRLVSRVLILLVLACPAVASAGSVRLAWDPNPEPDIAGYVIYYGTTSRSYSHSVVVGLSTSYEVTGLTSGGGYYFAVLAYNTEGATSPLSDEVAATAAPTSSLTVVVGGAGLVSSSPAGIACGTLCRADFGSTVTVALTAVPAEGNVFAAWSGDADCATGRVAMTADRACVAMFVTRRFGPVGPSIMDLNGDGTGDLLRYDPSTGAWSMDFSDHLGQFGSRAGNWSPGWQVYPADFNGDGLTDVLLYNPATGTAYEAVNAGGDFTYSRVDWSPGWTVTVLDLNGDGRSDLLLYHATTGTPAGGFTYAGGAMSEGWQVTVADFNGDRRSDLFLYRPTDGIWFTGRATGPGTFTWAQGTWGPGWTVIASRTP